MHETISCGIFTKTEYIDTGAGKSSVTYLACLKKKKVLAVVLA